MGGPRRGRSLHSVTQREAAERLGVSVEAIRKREKRGTLRSDKGEDGRRDNTMTFIGEVATTEEIGRLDVPGPEQRHVPHGSPYTVKESTAVLRMLVDVDHAPGHYELLSLVCRTSAGRSIGVRTDDPDVSIESDSFRVLREQEALDPQGVLRVKILDEDS